MIVGPPLNIFEGLVFWIFEGLVFFKAFVNCFARPS